MTRYPILLVLVVAPLVLALASIQASALTIAPLSSKELVKRSTIIVIGKVESVKDNTGSGGKTAKGKQYLSVTVGTLLKGKTSTTVFTIVMDHGSSRKSFDPKLAKGDVAIFFLRSLQEGEGTLTHWGSVAPFRGAYLYKP